MTPRLRFVVVGMAATLAVTLASCANPPTEHPSSSGTPSASAAPSPSASLPTALPPPTATPTSSPSSRPNAAPGQVHGLKAVTGGGSGEVLLTWTQNPESDVVSYVVLRASTASGAFSRIGTASRHDVTLFPGDPFVDSEATVNYYKVRAVDSAGQQGPASAVVCGTGLGTNGSSPGDTC